MLPLNIALNRPGKNQGWCTGALVGWTSYSVLFIGLVHQGLPDSYL